MHALAVDDDGARDGITASDSQAADYKSKLCVRLKSFSSFGSGRQANLRQSRPSVNRRASFVKNS